MKRFLFSCLLLLVFQNFFSQNLPDSVIMTINGKPVTVREFEHIKDKNKNPNSQDTTSIKTYFNLFLDYKLKLEEANAQGIDTSEKFLEEFDKYTKQIANPYIYSSDIKESIVKEAYTRLLTDVKVGHILIKLASDATPEDTLSAFIKAEKIRKRIIQGEDFSKVAKATSDDPTVSNNEGIIGYITAFSTPYFYENVVYSLKPGQVSNPVKAPNGYYIIKVFEKRPSKGEVKVKHIMLLKDANNPDFDKTAKETLDSVYTKLKAGEDFTELSKRYSTEPTTKESGGDMNYFDNSSNLPSVFKETAFNLKQNEISVPFKTEYGWHIIKLINKINIQPYEKRKEQLQSWISNNPTRRNLTEEIAYSNLKKKLNFSVNTEVLNVLADKIEESVLSGTGTLPEGVNLNATILTINSKKYNTIDFANWILKNQKVTKKKIDKSSIISKLFEEFSTQELLKIARLDLLNNPKYKVEIQDYYDGMLIFEITDQNVWSKANKDTVGQLDFYNKNKEKYFWDTRLKANIYICKDSSVVESLKKVFDKKQKKNISTEEILKQINKKDSTLLSIDTKIYSKGDNKIIDSFEWKTGVIKWQNPKTAVEMVEIIAPQQKEFNQCKGLVISDFQKMLENKWIEDIKSKYTVVINYKLLDSIHEDK